MNPLNDHAPASARRRLHRDSGNEDEKGRAASEGRRGHIRGGLQKKAQHFDNPSEERAATSGTSVDCGAPGCDVEGRPHAAAMVRRRAASNGRKRGIHTSRSHGDSAGRRSCDSSVTSTSASSNMYFPEDGESASRSSTSEQERSCSPPLEGVEIHGKRKNSNRAAAAGTAQKENAIPLRTATEQPFTADRRPAATRNGGSVYASGHGIPAASFLHSKDAREVATVATGGDVDNIVGDSLARWKWCSSSGEDAAAASKKSTGKRGLKKAGSASSSAVLIPGFRAKDDEELQPCTKGRQGGVVRLAREATQQQQQQLPDDAEQEVSRNRNGRSFATDIQQRRLRRLEGSRSSSSQIQRRRRSNRSGQKSETAEKREMLTDGRGNTGGKAAVPRAPQQGEKQSKRYQTLLHVDNPHELSDEYISDEEEDEIRNGNVPLSWYDALDHIGYNWAGEPVARRGEDGISGIEKWLRESKAGEGWRTVVDVRNNRTVRLTDTDLEIIRRVVTGAFPLPTTAEDEFYVESDREDSIFPMHNKPEPKRRFLPSQHEQRKITRLVALIRSGKLLKQEAEAAEARAKQEALFDMWKADIYTLHSSPLTAAASSLHPLLRAPKLPLPGHAESYNPPEEFLFTPQEEKEWKEMEAEDRPLSFVPRRFAALRHVGAFQDLLLERFNRCLDLYICPRAVKLRMNVDPASLLPDLPPLRELRPFPTSIRIDFLPVSSYAQLQLPPCPLNTLPAAVAPLRSRLSGVSGAPLLQVQQTAREAVAENQLRFLCDYISKGISGISIDPTGTWLAVGENIETSTSSHSTCGATSLREGIRIHAVETTAAAAEEEEIYREDKQQAPARLWIFEIATGKAFLSFNMQQHITAVIFHPRLPLLAVAVEEQLLLLVLDLPLFDNMKLHTLTSNHSFTSENAATYETSNSVHLLTQEKKRKKQRGASTTTEDNTEDVVHTPNASEASASKGFDGAARHVEMRAQVGKADSRRSLLEEAATLILGTECEASPSATLGNVRGLQTQDERRCLLGYTGNAATAPAAEHWGASEQGDVGGDVVNGENDKHGDETPGADTLQRQQQQRCSLGTSGSSDTKSGGSSNSSSSGGGIGALGEWRAIRVKGIATAPVSAGTAGRKISTRSRMQHQQQSTMWLPVGGNSEKKMSESPITEKETNSSPSRTEYKEKAYCGQATDTAESPENSDLTPGVVCAPLGGILCGVSIIHDSTIRSLSWHHKGGYLVAVCPGSASPTQQCSIHSLRKKKTIHPFRKAAGGRLQSAVFHPTKPCLILAYPRTIRIVDLQRRKVGENDDDDDPQYRKLTGADNISCVDVHSEGKQIVAGSGDRSVYVFDLDLSPRVYKTLRNHTGAVPCVGVHPRYPLLFTASHDGCASAQKTVECIWDIFICRDSISTTKLKNSSKAARETVHSELKKEEEACGTLEPLQKRADAEFQHLTPFSGAAEQAQDGVLACYISVSKSCRREPVRTRRGPTWIGRVGVDAPSTVTVTDDIELYGVRRKARGKCRRTV